MDLQSLKFYSSVYQQYMIAEVFCIHPDWGANSAFIAKMKLKPQGGEFAKSEVVLGVEIMVGGSLNSWEGRIPPILRYPTWFVKPPPPLTTSSKWQNHPPWVNSPPFCGSDLEPLLWWLEMLLYAHKCPRQDLQQLWHLRDKFQTSCFWFRNWIFSNFSIYLTLWVIMERKSKLIIENY